MPSSGIFLTATVLFICGSLSGYLMHRSDFCMAGAFRDLFLLRNISMLKPLLILVTTIALLFEIESLAGLVKSPFPFYGNPNIFGLLGGLLFGCGMVLSGGCVFGVLYKSGSGNRAAMTAILGLIVGSAIYAEFHQFLSPLIRKTKLSTSISLPQLTGISSFWWVLVLFIVTLFIVRRWTLSGTLIRTNYAEGYIQPWLAAVLIGLLVAVAAAVSGVPFGITTSYLKVVAEFEKIFTPQHFATLSIFSTQPISYTLPLTGEVLTGGAGPGFDVISLLQYPLIAGVFLGAAFSSVRLNEWSWTGYLPFAQALTVFIGGIFMALGSRVAAGCNVWHLWGGLPIFALQSLLFLLGLLPGAWLGSLIIKRVILSQG